MSLSIWDTFFGDFFYHICTNAPLDTHYRLVLIWVEFFFNNLKHVNQKKYLYAFKKIGITELTPWPLR